MFRVPRPARKLVLGVALVAALVGAGAAIAGSSTFVAGWFFTPGGQGVSGVDSAAQRWNGVEWYSKSNTGGGSDARIALIDASSGAWSCSTTGTASSTFCFLGAWSYQKKGLCKDNGTINYTMSCRVYFP
ncbi:MAG: hypothetical protein R3C15_07620 [Thermoleophilia bacterium]